MIRSRKATLPGPEGGSKGRSTGSRPGHSLDAEVRLYDRLFTVENPSGDNWKESLNPHSLEILKGCKVEEALASAKPQDRMQFERMGYFCVDDDSRKGALVFNRAVTLRDTWAKIQKS